jgi:hypothetical protein
MPRFVGTRPGLDRYRRQTFGPPYYLGQQGQVVPSRRSYPKSHTPPLTKTQGDLVLCQWDVINAGTEMALGYMSWLSPTFVELQVDAGYDIPTGGGTITMAGQLQTDASFSSDPLVYWVRIMQFFTHPLGNYALERARHPFVLSVAP